MVIGFGERERKLVFFLVVFMNMVRVSSYIELLFSFFIVVFLKVVLERIRLLIVFNKVNCGLG